MASFSETSAMVLKGVQTCAGNADCYAVSAASGVDLAKTRIALHSLLINELVEVVSVSRRQKINGKFAEFNLYGLTGKGREKLKALDEPKPKPEPKTAKPKPVEVPKKTPIEVKKTVCESPGYEGYLPTIERHRGYTPRPLRSLTSMA